MASPLPNLRYERKFLAETSTLAEVLATIRRHPAAFREVYPSRIVNNIYLDSPALRDYHAHVNGAADRAKTRVRWYGPRWDVAERPRLERKLKRGLVSGKEAYALPPIAIHGGRLRSQLATAFDTAGLPHLLRAVLRHLEPTLVNRYERHYFLSGDGEFRLTVDGRLQFAEAVRAYQQAITLSPPAPTLILEVKFGPERAEDADTITNEFPFRMARFSKYVTGMEHT